MLIIDPHLGWFGRQRFWELRLHAARIHASGFATAGVPYVGLGHSSDVAWAHTTGGPDTADIYTLELNPKNPLQYRYDDSWREIKARKALIRVKDEEKSTRSHLLRYSLRSYRREERQPAYAAKLAYAMMLAISNRKYLFNIAKDYKDGDEGNGRWARMPQNVMIADTSGNIYYQRTGHVPITPGGV